MLKSRATWLIAFALSMALIFEPSALAEVYKWVDEQGVIHYTDRPPEGRQSTEMALPTPPEPQAPAATTASPAETTWYDQWLTEQRERRRLQALEREAESTARGAEQAHMLEVCAKVRQSLEVLETPCRAFFDGRGVLRNWCRHQITFAYTGDFRFVEDDERASMIQHHRQQLRECDAGGY